MTGTKIIHLILKSCANTEIFVRSLFPNGLAHNEKEEARTDLLFRVIANLNFEVILSSSFRSL